MELTLGSLQFNWPADAWSDFYARIADEAPVDRVVIGELICSKRLPFYADRIGVAVERLQRAGKRVTLASLALITLPRERHAAASLFADGETEVEINDLTLMRWARGVPPFSIGPLVNVYNESTLRFLARRGARSICLPPELPFASVRALADAARETHIGLEVWAFGRAPLAISARCYHARAHGLSKDSCQFVCDRDPDGLQVDTLDAKAFLVVNGVQTLSYNCVNLIGDLAELADAGVTALRLSPYSGDFVGVAKTFHDVIRGALESGAAVGHLGGLVPPMPFSRGFMFGASGAATTD